MVSVIWPGKYAAWMLPSIQADGKSLERALLVMPGMPGCTMVVAESLGANTHLEDTP